MLVEDLVNVSNKYSWKSWGKQFLFRTSCPCRCFNLGKSHKIINLHLCVCRMRAPLGAEPTFPPEPRWCRSWRRWSGRTWSSMTWCCSSSGRSSCAPGTSTTAHSGLSSSCPCTTWRSVRSALLIPATRYQSCGAHGGICGEFAGKSPEKMSPFCKESSDLEP